MLVLTRKTQEKIQIGDDITVTIVRIKGGSVRIGIEAPDNIPISRGELTKVFAEFRDAEQSERESKDSSRSRGSKPVSLHRDVLRKPGASESNDGSGLCQQNEPPSRIPGVRRPLLVRRPPRLGPASFTSLSCW